MWTELCFAPRRATRCLGQPAPEQRVVIRALLGARTVRREICAPSIVSTPLMRTIGNGFIRFARLWRGAAATVVGTGACWVGKGCGTGWTGTGAGGWGTGGGGVGVGVGVGVRV